MDVCVAGHAAFASTVGTAFIGTPGWDFAQRSAGRSVQHLAPHTHDVSLPWPGASFSQSVYSLVSVLLSENAQRPFTLLCGCWHSPPSTQVEKRFPNKETAKLLVSCADGRQYSIDALEALDEAGYTNLVGLRGGYYGWFK